MRPSQLSVAGEFRLNYDWEVPLWLDEDGVLKETPWYPNSIVNSGYDLLGQMVASRISGPNYVYLEFANVAEPGTPVEVPEIDVTGGIEYYRGLSTIYDYLRLPLEITPSLDATSNAFSTNRVTFYAVSSGSTGNRTAGGLPFSYAAKSVVYGIAIVYAPDPGDLSRDVLFSRGYPPQNMQKAKPQNGQVTMTWRVKFE